MFAFSCGANLLLYEGDPGPQTTTVGGPGEQRTITRRELLVSIYARMLLLELQADLDRLAAVAAEARRRMYTAADDDATELAAAEAVAVELAETAIQIIRDVGADTDPRARERLLAATDYQTSRDVFGTFLGKPGLAGPPDSMLEELARIERSAQGQ